MATFKHIGTVSPQTLCGLDEADLDPNSNQVFHTIQPDFKTETGWCPHCIAMGSNILDNGWRERLDETGVLATAQALWMHKTGASDDLSDESLARHKRYLIERVLTWRIDDTFLPGQDVVDAAVLAYLRAVLMACA